MKPEEHVQAAEYWTQVAEENWHGGSNEHAMDAARAACDIARAHAVIASASAQLGVRVHLVEADEAHTGSTFPHPA